MPEAKLNDNVNDVTSYSSASSSTENAADLHNYNGFDEHTEARIQKLARTLTAQSMQNSTQSAPNKSDAQSIFSSGVEGVNPIFSDLKLQAMTQNWIPTPKIFLVPPGLRIWLT